jgi:large subunit ribosomal protein L4
MELEVVNSNGQSSGKITLPDDVFNVKTKKHLVYEAVKSYMANQRLGTAMTKRGQDRRGPRGERAQDQAGDRADEVRRG